MLLDVPGTLERSAHLPGENAVPPGDKGHVGGNDGDALRLVAVDAAEQIENRGVDGRLAELATQGVPRRDDGCGCASAGDGPGAAGLALLAAWLLRRRRVGAG